MKLDGKVRLALATWAKAILGDAGAAADKKALAKEIYASGVDGWAGKLFVFVQTHFSAPTDDTIQSAVNDIVTSVVNDYLAAKAL